MTKQYWVNEKNASVNILVEPIKGIISNITNTKIKNIAKDKIISITIGDKKPRINEFFPFKTKMHPCTHLEYLEEADYTDSKVTVWAILSRIIKKTYGEEVKA